MIETEMRQWIDTADYESLLRRWRFSPAGSPWFQGEMGLSFTEIARQIGTNHSRISRSVALLDLEPDVQAMFDRGELPVLLVTVLAKVKDLVAQKRLALASARRHMTVPQLEEIVKRNMGTLNEIKRNPAPLAKKAKYPAENLPADGRREAIVTIEVDR